MRIIETKAYKFDELSDDAKAKAVENLYNLNVDYNWWDSVFEDAQNIGLKISGFDIDRGKIEGELMLSALEVAANIIRDHGDGCETYKIADKFLEKHSPIFAEYMTEPDNAQELEEELGDIEHWFSNDLMEEYLSILRKDFEHRTSFPEIQETIIAQEYEFTEEGNLI
jgi:hypothetical protein